MLGKILGFLPTDRHYRRPLLDGWTPLEFLGVLSSGITPGKCAKKSYKLRNKELSLENMKLRLEKFHIMWF